MENQGRCQCPPYYLRTVPGILKILEMIFTILTFAISLGGAWSYYGGGWVEFTGISCFITITIWFILHLINCVPQILVNFLIEFISYCVMTVMLMISGIVAASRASDFSWGDEYWRSMSARVGACSFFAFAAMIACGVDAFMQFLQYRQGSSTTTTTTTTTTSATKVEY